MAWERNGLFPAITDAAEMMDSTTVQYNGQILDLSIQYRGRVVILLKKELINHEANKGYHTRKTKSSVFTERT
jgi:hypothetical protein